MSTNWDLDVTSICQSFPECALILDSKCEVQRENIIDTIELILNSDIQVVFLEGEEGIGKTSLLIQFCKKHKEAICLFIRSANRWGYDPNILRFDLCNQINYILHEEELTIEQADETCLNTGVINLSREARRSKKILYFIIDGLEDLSEINATIRDSIIGMLPLGVSNFRFIISGSSNMVSEAKLRGLLTKPHTLSGFTYDETEKFFGDIKIKREQLKEIYKNCKKVPGRLNTAKKIIKSGMSVEELLLEKTDQWKDLFEIEWKKYSFSDMQIKILSILALDNKNHPTNEISKILKIKEQNIIDEMYELDFICIDRDKNDELKFDTEAFRKFVAEKLKYNSQYVNELYVDYLLEQPDCEESLNYLPSYLEKVGKYDILLKYLSPEHFLQMLSKSQSLMVVQQKIDLGIATSQKLNRNEDLLRFCVQKSIIKELENAQIWRSEVEARMSINDFDSALALAQTTIIKEERLHLLAVVCKNKKEKGLLIEPELLEQIKTLYNELNDNIVKDKIIEIASDLIFTCPDLAIEMVEKSNRNSTGENELDLAFAKLSLAALSSSEDEEYKSTIDNISSKIKNQDVRDLSNSVILIVGKYSADKVISEVEKLDSATNKLFLIKEWTRVNKHREDAVKVVEYALNLTIITTAYSPNASILKALALPLPYVGDNNKCHQLINSIDAQKDTIERLGPTEDYIELQIVLARAESKLDFKLASNRLIEIYLYISDIKDLSIRTACLAYLYASLAIIDSNNILEATDQLHTLTKNDLDTSLDNLLNTTAYHYQAIKQIIIALAKKRFQTGYEICKMLNTQKRRDMSIKTLIQTALNVKLSKIDAALIISVMNEIVNEEIYDEVLEYFLERLNNESGDVENSKMIALKLIEKAYKIGRPEIYCYSICNVYSILCKDSTDKQSTLKEKLLIELRKKWESIDVGWGKVNLGYKIVTMLSKVSIEVANDFFGITEGYKKEIVIYSNNTAKTFISGLRLAVRAYSGLIPKKLNTSHDLERLSVLIDNLPSYGERAELWADLALRCYRNKELEQCKKIITDHVLQLLQYIERENNQYWNDLIICLAPALYCNHKLTTFDIIGDLYPNNRDEAYMSICNFIITKQTFIDPYNKSRKNGYNIDFTEIIDLCEILSKINRDDQIYTIISAISETINFKRNKYTKQQIADIIAKLTNIVEEKLPDRNNIQHEGYKIIANAEIARLKKSNIQQWEVLIRDAYKISNLADKSYVLCIISTLLSNKDIILSKKLLNESKDIIDELPSIFDRISHYESLASTAWMFDQVLSKKCLQTAMEIATKNNEIELYNEQRSIIDLAHRLDPDLASALAALSDDDNARIDIKDNIRNQNKINKLKKTMSEKSNISNEDRNCDIDYCNASWKLLASLNSGGIEPIHSNDSMRYIDVVSRLPLTNAYPILAWIIENSIQRHSKTDYAQIIIRQMFESTLLGAELSLRMAQRSTDIIKRTKYSVLDQKTNESLLINPGEREKAIEYIREWIEKEAKDNIKICDPYFGLDDLELLRIIKSANPNCSVQVITSIKHQKQEKYEMPWENTYRTYWNYGVSEQDPPFTTIVIVGTQLEGNPPIHDRWLLSNSTGLRIGTSFNSLGLSKISEISILSKSEVEQNVYVLDQYLNMTKREFNGEKLQFTSFTM